MRCFQRLWVLVTLGVLFAGVGAANVPESAFNKDPWPAAKEGPVRKDRGRFTAGIPMSAR